MIWILGFAILITALAFFKSPRLAVKGGQAAANMVFDFLPALIAGFLLAGMIQVILPKELVATWAGEGSGFKGLMLATATGALTPGGPFVQFPLVAALWQAGVGIGPVTAYLVSWSLLGFNKMMIWEVPVMGWRYALAKALACLGAPILIGWVTALVYQRIGAWM